MRGAVVRGVTVLGFGEGSGNGNGGEGVNGIGGGGEGGRCDLSGWAGDDLGGLVRGLVLSNGAGGGGKKGGLLLRFEVEVGSVGGGGGGNGIGEGGVYAERYAMPPPPPLRMTPGSGISPGAAPRSMPELVVNGVGAGQRMVFPLPGVMPN